jgi:hypothetical protein
MICTPTVVNKRRSTHVFDVNTDEHGQDLGNGWLLRHPIKKIGNFQRFHFAARHEEGDN